MLDNYIKLSNSVIHQINYNKIKYDSTYSGKYDKYGESSNYMSYLRLGALLGSIRETPRSIIDIGYGNGSFVKACNNIIPNCYCFDISDYPVPDGVTRVTNIYETHYDVVTFFDSLEHFDDIYEIKKLQCNYVMISVPWCHYLSDDWFSTWKHRRPDEHLWHFDKESLTNFFTELGYDRIYCSNIEDTIRKDPNIKVENILTCIFKKNT